jgi:hypothetical protein
MRIHRTIAATVTIATLISATALSGSARAEPVVISAGSASVSVAGDTITLASRETTIDYPGRNVGLVLQTGTFRVADTALLDQTFLFTLSRLVSIAGVTQVVSQTGLLFIRPGSHALSLLSPQPIFFDLGYDGSPLLQLGSVYLSASTPGMYAFSMSAGLTPVPEPSTLALVGIAVAGWGARRMKSAVTRRRVLSAR